MSEVANLKVSDIDSERMTLRVRARQGAARPLRDAFAATARVVAQNGGAAARPQAWLFPGQNPVNPMSARQLVRAVHAAAQAAGIAKRVSPHTLRHSFATHLLEQNVDIRVIQVLLEVTKLETTALYTRVAVNAIRDVKSHWSGWASTSRAGHRPPDEAAWRRLAWRSPTFFGPDGAAWRKANAGHVKATPS